MRLFISIVLNEALLAETVRQQEVLRNELSKKIRYVKPERMHLTLKFLGDVQEETAVEVKTILSEISSIHSAFQIRLGSGGCFPLRGSARIAWLGINEVNKGLFALQDHIEKLISPLGFPSEFPEYLPHLTLAYNKDNKAAPLMRRISEGLQAEPLTQDVLSFQLEESILQGSKSRYETLARFRTKELALPNTR